MAVLALHANRQAHEQRHGAVEGNLSVCESGRNYLGKK